MRIIGSKEAKWPPRSELILGGPNIPNQSLVDKENIIFPPFHIKLGLIKQFVKDLSIEGDCSCI